MASALGVLAAVGALAGCGSSSDSKSDSNGVASEGPQQILAAAKSAAAKADSVTVNGTSSLSKLVKTAVVLELTQTGGQGTVELIKIKLHLIRTGDAIYVKGSDELYERLGIKPPASPETWVKLPANSALAPYADLAGETTRLLSTKGTVTKGAATTVEGQPAIELKTEGKLYRGQLFVKTTGEPLPIKLEKAGRETGAFTFSKWNTTPAPVAPTNFVSVGG